MQSQCTNVTVQRLVRCCVAVFAATATQVLPSADGAEPPSLEHIKARMSEQREKIGSLYIRTETETSSPMSLEELRRLPGFERHSHFRRTENQFAFKGQKRFSHTKFARASLDPLPVPEPRPDETPMEKTLREYWADQEKTHKERKAQMPSQPRLAAQDEMKGFNGRAFWNRLITDLKHPDGRVEKTNPAVRLWPPSRIARLMSPPLYLRRIGMAVTAPDIGDESPEFQRRSRTHLLPDLLEFGQYTVQDGIETVDGAKCVVLNGKFETSFTLRHVTEKYVTRDSLWIDMEHGMALRKREQTKSPDRTGALRRVVNTNFEELAPGVWLPRNSELRVIAPADDPNFPEAHRGKPILTTRVTLIKGLVNDVPDRVFEPYIKPGDTVSDNRGGE